jgi:hypothetical protein
MCDCDRRVTLLGKSLVQGKIQSCGCLRSEVARKQAKANSARRLLPTGEAALRQIYRVYKWQAQHRHLPFNLSKEEFKTLTQSNCAYCGKKPLQVAHPFEGSSGGDYLYNGIDRTENDLGYTLKNCVSCCGVCNDMKRTRSTKDFLEACFAVFNYQKQRAGGTTNAAHAQCSEKSID